MIELQEFLDRIQAAGTGGTVALGALFVLVAIAMALKGLRS